MVFYVNLEQNMSLFGQILWLGPLSSDISLFLFRVLFHVLKGFELADREIIEKQLGGGKAAGVEIGFKIEKKAEWIAPRIFHYISFALHFICITLHLHLKIVPRQHEMHDTSRFKCHALHLHFMK